MFLYFLFFTSVGIYTWRLGAIPLLPHVQPRMASEHHGATRVRQLEPPGFLATSYGYKTPLAALLAQAVYGGVLGACVQIQHAMLGRADRPPRLADMVIRLCGETPRNHAPRVVEVVLKIRE